MIMGDNENIVQFASRDTGQSEQILAENTGTAVCLTGYQFCLYLSMNRTTL